jgi:ferredoxin-type protein NapG
MPDDPRFDRRRFFREGLRELLKPISKVADPIQRAIQQFEAVSNEVQARSSLSTPVDSASGKMPSVWLRPPGAMFPDQSFRDTCSRCRKCVEVCPAQCIKIDPAGHRGEGAPYIAAEEMPCVVCEGLKCMHECPTGALSPIPLNDIDMGTAVWNEGICVRTKQGTDCTICIDLCPIGSVAIELHENKVKVHPDGCVGCGVCQQRCPTEPKSIIVLSREVWEDRISPSPSGRGPG